MYILYSETGPYYEYSMCNIAVSSDKSKLEELLNKIKVLNSKFDKIAEFRNKLRVELNALRDKEISTIESEKVYEIETKAPIPFTPGRQKVIDEIRRRHYKRMADINDEIDKEIQSQENSKFPAGFITPEEEEIAHYTGASNYVIEEINEI